MKDILMKLIKLIIYSINIKYYTINKYFFTKNPKL